MTDLKRLHRPVNPEAARLANFYVPMILANMRTSKAIETAQEIKVPAPLTEFQKSLEQGFEIMAAQAKKDAEEAARRKNRAENGYQPESELAPEDVEALLELPL